MLQNRLLHAVLLLLAVFSTSMFAQQPLTSNPAAVGVLGANDLITNTNYTLPTISTLAEPASVAIDPTTGKLFVADRDNRRVLRFGSQAKLVNGASAEAVFGQPDYVTRTANTGGISATSMNNPNSVVVDAQGRLWVADRDNNRILRFDNASSKASSAAADGVLGQATFTTNKAGIAADSLNAPASLAVDKNGRLWVADRANNRILRFDAAAAKANGAAANGVLGQPDFVTRTSGTTASTMSAPWGVAADASGRVWVADRSNSRVLRFDSAATRANGAAANGVLGQANFTSSAYAKTQGGLGEPRGVAVDLRGRLYVADEGNTRIMVYDAAAGKADGALADYVIGQADFVSDVSANPPTANSLNYPISLCVDPMASYLWVPDIYNHRILRYLVGPPSAFAVLGTNNLTTNTDWTNPTDSTFAEPASVAIDPTTGKIFVADRDNRRVLRFASAMKYANGAKAEAVFGQPGFITRVANNGGISAASMNNPNGVSVDVKGRLWVADRDNNRVLRFDNASSKASSAPADGVLGQPDFVTNSAGATGGKMSAPAGLHADAAGRLWVADRANNRVLRYDNAAEKANGGTPNGVLGQDGFSSVTSGTTAATMNGPWGVFADAAGRVWVADRSNSRVLRFDNAASKSNGADANGVLGQSTFTTSAYATSQAGLGEPRGVAVDANGRLYVADEGNTRVMVYDNAAAKANGANADNVYGQINYTSDTSPNPPAPNSLAYPLSVCIDNTSSIVLIPDIYNHRILSFWGPAITLTAPTAPVVLNAFRGSGQLTLRWGKSPEGDVVKYRIYVGTSANPTTKVDSTTGGVSDTVRVVTGLTNDMLYYVRVKAVNMYGLESGYSNEVTGTPSAFGTAVGVLGTTNFVTNTNWTNPTDSTFAEPASVAVDPTTGKIFVADRDNRRVLRFSAAAKLVNGAKAEAVFGQPGFITRVANNGGISASSMNNPNGVSVDADGRLWVADRDNHRVLRFDNASSKASSAAADGVLGQPDFVTNSSGASGGKMNAPASVHADAQGRLWVADRANNRVLRYDAAASKENGAAPNGVLGQDSYSGTTSGTTAATMNGPWGVFMDANGRLWVADRSNSRVLRFDNAATKSNGADANGVLGQTTFTSSTYAKTQSGLGEPRGVTVDAAGRLYVADEGNTRVMVYDNAAAKTNGGNADQVYGQFDFTSDASPNPPTAASLAYPLSVFVENTTGHVWIPDIYNHRVLRFNGPAISIVAPTAPQNLTVLNGNTQVTLKWGKNAGNDVLRYRIYRGTSANLTTKVDSTSGAADTTKVLAGLTNGTKYYFRVTAVNAYGMESGYSNEVNATPSPNGLAPENGSLPTVYALSQNYPNPFNPSTTIAFALPEASSVSLKVLDMLGREVATLVGGDLNAGYYSYDWNASGLSSGVYIYRITATSNGTERQNFVQVRKLMLQK
ncbi:MAG: SMP-30/gluconolactonase/LRE family protein [Bacteroidetes bacterium]|nr:SMP-30/gluconolactonase/LRE family protein [Bacteroidota bacterium]